MMPPQSRSLGSTCHCRDAALRNSNSVSVTGCWGLPDQQSAGHVTCCTRGANDQGALGGRVQDRRVMVEDQEADADEGAHRLAGVDGTVGQTNLSELLPCTGDATGNSKVTEAAVVHSSRGSLHI